MAVKDADAAFSTAAGASAVRPEGNALGVQTVHDAAGGGENRCRFRRAVPGTAFLHRHLHRFHRPETTGEIWTFSAVMAGPEYGSVRGGHKNVAAGFQRAVHKSFRDFKTEELVRLCLLQRFFLNFHAKILRCLQSALNTDAPGSAGVLQRFKTCRLQGKQGRVAHGIGHQSLHIVSLCESPGAVIADLLTDGQQQEYGVHILAVPIDPAGSRNRALTQQSQGTAQPGDFRQNFLIRLLHFLIRRGVGRTVKLCEYFFLVNLKLQLIQNFVTIHLFSLPINYSAFSRTAFLATSAAVAASGV